MLLDNKALKEITDGEGYTWTALEKGGGVLWVRRKNGNKVVVE